MLDVVTSALLRAAGFAHGFSLRGGGLSEGAFASLNLDVHVGDDPARVQENHRRFAAAVGYEPERRFEVTQVHGARCVEVREGDEPAALRALEADALVSGVAGVALGVRTADCVPVLLADPRSGAVAAAHAGWRGAVAGVVPRAVDLLRDRFGVDPVTLYCAIGPYIRPDAFEIGEEVAAEIDAAAARCGAASAVRRSSVAGAKPHADLAALLTAQLVALGVPPAHIDDTGGCTFAEPDRFYSHRRDQGHTGRHFAVIVARG